MSAQAPPGEAPRGLAEGARRVARSLVIAPILVVSTVRLACDSPALQVRADLLPLRGRGDAGVRHT